MTNQGMGTQWGITDMSSAVMGITVTEKETEALSAAHRPTMLSEVKAKN